MRLQAIILSFIAAVCGIIVLGVFFGAVFPTITDRHDLVQTTCTSLSLGVSSYRCCTYDNCGCSECPVVNPYGQPTPICDDDALSRQPLNKSICCGSSACCSTYSYQCCTCGYGCCLGTCTQCTSSVNHQTCQFACTDECYHFRLIFSYATYKGARWLDDCTITSPAACRDKTIATFAANATWPCFYDPSNASNADSVRFDGLPSWNMGAIVCTGLFGGIGVICVIAVLVDAARNGCCCRRTLYTRF